MRTFPVLFLVVGLLLSGCDDPGGPDPRRPDPGGPDPRGPSPGTLVVSTSTGGNAPDQDGYLLTVDGAGSLRLNPSGTSAIDLPAGQHTLGLLGMAEDCSVSPGTPLSLEVPSRDTTSVAFEVTCSVTGVRITTTTIGLDLDFDGYRVAVDGTDRGVVHSTGTVLTEVDPGSHTIALTGLSPNCTIDGSRSRTVTNTEAEIVPIDFAVVCTATTGLIVVSVEASGTDVQGDYEVMVDGARAFSARPGGVALANVPVGEHVVSLVPPTHCSVETDPQPVTLTGGSLIRDTVEMTFRVTCARRFEPTLSITAPTTGRIPEHDYSVWICDGHEYYCRYGGLGSWRLGALAPNGSLAVEQGPGNYVVWLRDVPTRCRVENDNGRFADVQTSGVLHVEFPVTCSP